MYILGCAQALKNLGQQIVDAADAALDGDGNVGSVSHTVYATDNSSSKEIELVFTNDDSELHHGRDSLTDDILVDAES